jgi:leucyl-tRNA synthetase
VAYIEYGILVNSGEFNGLCSEDARKAITDYLVQQNKGKTHTAYRLRDWGISRQRYWGTPIPIIYCEHCGTVPVPEAELPVKLPENIQFDGSIPSLSEIPDFYQTQCPQCNKPARRETDTFDTFMESSWYYLRYACPELKTAMLDQRANHWSPVDQYIGGIEHAVMHLLYVRFMHKLLREQGLVNSDEPIQHLLTQGMVLKDGSKMSKSKGNTIDPATLIQNYGADSLRLFIIFTAPPEQSLEWSDSGFEGMHRFLKRLYAWAMEHKSLLLHDKEKNLQLASAEQKEHYKAIHLTLKQAQHDYDRLQLNTVVSSGMKLFNTISKITADNKINQWLITHGLRILLQVIAPIAPHISHHLWQTLGYGNDILQQGFPQWDKAALETEAMQLIVQVNGKLRCKINVPSLANENEIKALALSNANIQKFIADQKVKKVIYVAKRLLNFVV